MMNKRRPSEKDAADARRGSKEKEREIGYKSKDSSKKYEVE